MLVDRVVESNWLSFRRSWSTDAVTAVAQPIVLLIVFAALLGRQASGLIADPGNPVAFYYSKYVAIGIACSSGVLAGAMEATHSTYSGFRFNDKFKTAVTTPVSAANLAIGTLIWAFFQGASISGILFLLATPFLSLNGLIWTPVFMILTGLSGTAVAAPLCALISRYYRTPQILNITGRVVLFPLMLFSATYFPTSVLPPWSGRLIDVFPQAHANLVLRDIYAGHWSGVVANLAVIAAWIGIGTAIMVRGFGRELYA